MPEAPGARVVVLGVGNELYRDDGVGVVAARELGCHGLPPHVEVIEGHVGGLDLLFEMEGATQVILIDAVDHGGAPGQVVVFTPDQVRLLPPGSIASLHEIGLEHVLELGALVGLTENLQVIGVQPEQVTAGFELSPAVQAAVPRVLCEVRRLLQLGECAVSPVPGTGSPAAPAGGASEGDSAHGQGQSHGCG